LDIAERAQLAIHGLTGPLDAKADYELYFLAEFMRNPPLMTHDFNDWCVLKFWEALPLLRGATGSEHAGHVDQVWTRAMLKCIGPDGLFYVPMEGRPWSRYSVPWGPGVWRADGTTTNISDKSVTQVTHPFPIGRVLSTLTLRYTCDKSPLWKTMGERMVDRTLQLMVDKRDYGYLPAGYFEPHAKVDPKAEIPIGLLGLESYARLIQGSAHFYRATRYEPARRLARKIIHCVRHHGRSFDAEGQFLADGPIEKALAGPHFHAHSFALLSMLEYAVAAGDRETIDFVKRSYAWARGQGSATVGFFPEFLAPDFPSSETCEVADMVALALKLSKAGASDSWDDADRWIRNQFAENQLTRIDGLRAAAERLPATPVQPHQTASRVLERNLGAFAGWPTANAWTRATPQAPYGVMHCCTGNGARTLYYIYESILDEKDDELRVHLLLNRAARSADVYSYLPYEGRVKLKIKNRLARILVRVPQWIDPKTPGLGVFVNGQTRPLRWQGRYLDLGGAQAGDEAVVVFAIQERAIKERIGGTAYEIMLRGNTVVAMDPPGKICPLYERDSLRKSQMPWRPVRRFVADAPIDW
jgi:hypothetical protein